LCGLFAIVSARVIHGHNEKILLESQYILSLARLYYIALLVIYKIALNRLLMFNQFICFCGGFRTIGNSGSSGII